MLTKNKRNIKKDYKKTKKILTKYFASLFSSQEVRKITRDRKLFRGGFLDKK